ncbi:hypothetical protein TRVA0_030S00848 [Trichomonascus vanleenenianus]|uniref:CORVET complex membrane-binding subunit VPS8 n=1 Tax=Trichomonascus vanleenenianus TaxID=2268995 RepID=UPI003EC973E0
MSEDGIKIDGESPWVDSEAAIDSPESPSQDNTPQISEEDRELPDAAKGEESVKGTVESGGSSGEAEETGPIETSGKLMEAFKSDILEQNGTNVEEDEQVESLDAKQQSDKNAEEILNARVTNGDSSASSLSTPAQTIDTALPTYFTPRTPPPIRVTHKDSESTDFESDSVASNYRSNLHPQNLLSPMSLGASTPDSVASGPAHSLDKRFTTRLASMSSIRTSSSNGSNTHFRHISQASESADNIFDSSDSPMEAIRWSKLRKLSNQLYAESAVAKFGTPTAVLPASVIAVGTSEGVVLIFDYHQNLKNILGLRRTSEFGSVTAMAVSADQTFLGVGYSDGHITTWDLTKSSQTPKLHIPPIGNDFIGQPKKDGHLEGASVIHICFAGKRHNALISGDTRGMVFAHNATRALVGRTIRSHRILGRYPQNNPALKRRPTSILACSAQPLGTDYQLTDEMCLVAVMTPYTLAIISTLPVPQTEFKTGKSSHVTTSMGLSACLAWFPALKASTTSPSSPARLAYCWSNVLTVLRLDAQKNPMTDEISINFTTTNEFVGDESLVAVQWLSRHVLALVTITQRLLIVNEQTMTVTSVVDILNKHIMHFDYFSRILHNLAVASGDDDEHQQTVVADAYFNSFRAFKGRVFLMGKYEFVVGSLSNWADRLLDIMGTGDYVGAIKLATNYYLGQDDLVTIGLPSNDKERHALVYKNLPEMILASLRYTFKSSSTNPYEPPSKEFIRDLTHACLVAIVAMEDYSLLEDAFEYYEEEPAIFLQALVPFIADGEITSLPPQVFKELVLLYAESPKTTRQLEELICSLDTSTLDLNLTLSLCKDHQLYDTQIYVWNHALADYVTPMIELIDIIAKELPKQGLTKSANLVAQAEKVYPYMSYVLTGRTYPTGLSIAPEKIAFHAKTMIYYLLLSPKTIDWPNDHLFESSRRSSSSSAAGGYPYLRALINFNTPALFQALNEAFEDSFLNDYDDSEPISVDLPTDELAFAKIINRQYIIDVLLALFDSYGQDKRIFLNIFVARNYPKYSQFLMLPGSNLSRILDELCYNQDVMLKEECELAIESLLSTYKPHDLENWIGVLYEMKLYRVLQFIFRSERRYAKLLEVTINLYTEESSILHDFKLLDVVAECLSHTSDNSKQRSLVEQQIADKFADLISMDCGKFVEIIARYSPTLHDQVFSLGDRPDLQFYYLQKQFELAHGGTEIIPGIKARNLYVSLLLKRGEVKEVSILLNTLLTGRSDIELPAVVHDIMEHNAIDILALMLKRQERFSEAMIYISNYLTDLSTEYYDETTTDARLKSLEDELTKYVYIGIEVCQDSEDNQSFVENEYLSTYDDPESVRLSESLWTKLINTLVEIAGAAVVETVDEADKTAEHKRTVSRRLLQEGLSALLDSTGRGVSFSERNATIIRIFKSVMAAPEGRPRTVASVRPVLENLFSAYRYQHTMLTVAHKLLDADAYIDLLHLIEARVRGWKITRSGECEGCGKKVIGVGVDAEWLYDEWEKWQKRKISSQPKQALNGLLKLSAKAQGKRPVSIANDDPSGTILVVFKCGHSYHLRCLRSLSSPGATYRDLQCIVCDS